MKVVAIVGSPRPSGNTSILVDKALQEIASSGIQTEKILLCRKNISPCLGHDDCHTIEACHQGDDADEIMERFLKADGVILACPTYFQNVTAQMKIFIDRFRFPYRRNIKSRAAQAGVISVASRTGADTVAKMLRDFLARATSLKPEQMFEVYGNARDAGDIKDNNAVIDAARDMGREMAKKLLNYVPA